MGEGPSRLLLSRQVWLHVIRHEGAEEAEISSSIGTEGLVGGRVACHHGLASYRSHCNPLHVWNGRKKLANINHEAVISTLLRSIEIALIQI